MHAVHVAWRLLAGYCDNDDDGGWHYVDAKYVNPVTQPHLCGSTCQLLEGADVVGIP